jgi:hypothetical protein
MRFQEVLVSRILVRELIAWDLDPDPDRVEIDRLESLAWQAQKELWKRPPYLQDSPLLSQQSKELESILSQLVPIVRASGEFDGMEWSLGIVDLKKLLAFQRRLCFDLPEDEGRLELERVEELVEFAIPRRPKESPYRVQSFGEYVEVRSPNPNFRVAFAESEESCPTSLPVHVSFGSPYIEVGEYGGRWFLRDGYHRVYRLLQQKIEAVPAVIVHTRTLEELGAAQPWFFSEEILFSDYPPRVLDYLNPRLIEEYERAAREKVIRLFMRETFEVCNDNECEER